MVRPRPWVPLLLLVSLTSVVGPLAPGSVAQDTGHDHALPEPFRQVSDRLAWPTALALHENTVAWASPGPNGSTDVVVHALDEGHDVVLTTVPARDDGAAVEVESLAFDGTWVVWSDDRFGQFDVFAVHRETRELRRVTDHPGKDIDVQVDDGLALWVRTQDLYMIELPDGEPTLIHRAVGPTAKPSLDGTLVAWSQPVGAQPAIFLRDVARPEANATALPRAPGTGLIRPFVDGELVAWQALSYIDGDPRRGLEGAQIQLADLDPDPALGIEVSVRNLTSQPTSVRDPTLGGGRIAWLELLPDRSTHLLVRELATDDVFLLPGPISKGFLSDTHLVVALDEDAPATVHAMAWADAPRPGDGAGLPPIAWGLAVAGAVLVVAGLVWGSVRARERDDNDGGS